jgi:hypothetical protein
VRFLLSSVYLPEAENALKSLSLDSEVEGTIVRLSDSGTRQQAFAVVEVVRRVTVVVPAGHFKLAEGEPGCEQDPGRSQ